MQSMLYNLVSTTLSKHRACKQALHAKRMCDNECLCNLGYAIYDVRPRIYNLVYAIQVLLRMVTMMNLC